MSGGLAPSKSTVYVSNLPFSLTNNDLHKIFEKHGRVAKVTIAKDNKTRQSKGVAFVLFVEKESAFKCVSALNATELFGRTIKCSIAKDNGRTPEFIRRKVYKDKTRCYECGEAGHLSYECTHNLLGSRQPPPKRDRKRKSTIQSNEEGDDSDEASRHSQTSLQVNNTSLQVDTQTSLQVDNLSASVSLTSDEEGKIYETRNTTELCIQQPLVPLRKRYKKDPYFSDEEELD